MQPTKSTGPKSASPGPDQITTLIQVETADNPGVGREGTFTSPPPKINVRTGDQIKWEITGGQTFRLDFANYGAGPATPFAQPNPITDSDFHTVVVDPGVIGVTEVTFHYAVTVTDTATGKQWKIKHCPEVGVGH